MKPRVVWLCSWYPNETDWFTGDFIQRHAVAASEVAEVDVVHVVHGAVSTKTTVQQVNASLRETIIYTSASNKLTRYWGLLKAYHHFFTSYENENGKPDMLHVHVAFPAGLIGWRWKQRWHIPMLLTEHYGIYNNTVADAFPSRSIFFKYATRWAVQAANLVLPVSEALASGMKQYLGSFPYSIVPNVVDTSLFYEHASIVTTPFRFIHVSNMLPVKNIAGLLQAFANVVAQRQDVELHLVGAQPDEYCALAQNLGLLNNHVFFHPECSYADVAEMVRKAHCGVLFSHSEMLPCSLLEWLCAGIPVIASKVGGIPEVVNSSNGLLVSVGNEAELTTAMLSMLNNYTQYHRASIAASASASFSYWAIAKQFEKIYSSLLLATKTK
jgi:glycosyltransferase involved in cell wall biosynthesis